MIMMVRPDEPTVVIGAGLADLAAAGVAGGTWLQRHGHRAWGAAGRPGRGAP